MVVQHNLQASNASRMLNLTTSSQAGSTQKLSSGYRINKASDDAAGLSISEKMRKQIRGLARASTNASDGISCVQTAEGALTEVHSMLQRMNELAVQAANGTNSESDRDDLQNEILQLTGEIDRISETTKFNETLLLKGGAGVKTMYINAHDAGLDGTLLQSTKEASFSMPSLQPGDKYKIGGVEYTIGCKDNRELAYATKLDENYKSASELFDFLLRGGAYLNFNPGMYIDGKGYDIGTVTDLNPTSAPHPILAPSDFDTFIKDGEEFSFRFESDGYYPVRNEFISIGDQATDSSGKIYSIGETEDLANNIVAKEDVVGKPVKYNWVKDTSEVVNNYYHPYHDFATYLKDDGFLLDVPCKQGFTLTEGDTINIDGKSYTINANSDPANSQIATTDIRGLIDNGTIVRYNGNEGQRFASLDVATGIDTSNTNLITADAAYTKCIVELKAASSIGATDKAATVNPEWTRIDQKRNYLFTNTIIFNIEKGSVNVQNDLVISLHAGADADLSNKISVTIAALSAKGMGIDGLSVSDATGKIATYAIDVIGDAIDKVSEQRASLGAVQNRLEHTIANLDNVVENTEAAESRIRDTDMADEMVEFSKNNILQQAGQAMLAQANQSTQGVMQLLQ